MTLTIIGFCIIAAALIGIIVVSAAKIRQLNIQAQEAKDRLGSLLEEENERQKDLYIVEDLVAEHKQEVTALENRKKELNEDIAAQVNNVERLKSSFETTEEEFKKKYMAERKEWLDERQEEYLRMQEDFVEQFREENKKKMDAAKSLTDTLDQLRSAASAATEVAKRHAEQENFQTFHSIQLPAGAKGDIEKIEMLLTGISAEASGAIAKVLWKVYYEKPVSDLIGRVIGAGSHTGIYRITNSLTQMCYIGQAVDIGDRWRQHVKRALNAEPRTQNKLYPAMYESGIENWTFEVIEECTRDKLNEREDYWQDFYHAKEYGYSIK